MHFRKKNIIAASTPPIRMKRHVVCQIMCTVGAKKPESGGVLLGPAGSTDITAFHFDSAAQCSGVTYSPDVVTLRRKMEQEWLPAGVDLKGFCHSHPGLERLSDGDMRYIRRLLEINPDMALFAAPIVLPEEFRICPIVVLRESPSIQRRTILQFF